MHKQKKSFFPLLFRLVSNSLFCYDGFSVALKSSPLTPSLSCITSVG